MNSKNMHRNVIRLIASTFVRLLGPAKFLLSRDIVPGHFEQRNVNGFITRVWVPAHRREAPSPSGPSHPATQDEPRGTSREPGAEVSYAAAEYMISLRLEPSSLDSFDTDTSLACV